jgi:hypothetical protein
MTALAIRSQTSAFGSILSTRVVPPIGIIGAFLSPLAESPTAGRKGVRLHSITDKLHGTIVTKCVRAIASSRSGPCRRRPTRKCLLSEENRLPMLRCGNANY